MKTFLHRMFLPTLLMCVSMLTHAQAKKDKFKFFCPDNDLRAIGFFVGAGSNNSISSISEDKMEFEVSESTSYVATLSPSPLWAINAEAGAFFVPKKGLFELIELGLGFKNFKGEESLNAMRHPGGDLSFPDFIDVKGEFSYSRVYARVNGNFMTLLGKKKFLLHGPAVMVENSVRYRESYDIPHLGLVDLAPRQSVITSVNYSAALGIKLKEGGFLDLYTQLPLISAGGATKSGQELIFSSAYRNFLIGIRYRWLKSNADRLCPAFDDRTATRKVVNRSAPRFGQW